jgi:hypothetical protein
MINIDRTATTLLMLSGGFTPAMIDNYFRAVSSAIKSAPFSPSQQSSVYLRLDALTRRADVFGTQRLKTPSHMPGRRMSPAREVFSIKLLPVSMVTSPPQDWAALFREMWETFESMPVSPRRRRQVLLDIPPPQ